MKKCAPEKECKKIGVTYYQSSINGNWFVKKTKCKTIIAGFAKKEHLMIFLNTL